MSSMGAGSGVFPFVDVAQRPTVETRISPLLHRLHIASSAPHKPMYIIITEGESIKRGTKYFSEKTFYEDMFIAEINSAVDHRIM